MSEKRVPDFIKDSHHLSSEEFSRQLSVWFEDRGVISDLRAHLRSQMIAALRGTSIGAKPSQKTASPKFQALNMLIAEFLLQQEHHYTLSVFTSEVPLQEFAGTPVGNLSRGNVITNNEGPPRFHSRDVWDILETLGLSPDSEESTRVYNMYQENQREALLTCIFRILPALSRNLSRTDQCKEAAVNMNEPVESFKDEQSKETDRNNSEKDPHNTEPNQELTVETLYEEITNFINQSNLKSDKKNNLQKRIKQLLRLEGKRVQGEAEQKYHRELVERERHIQGALIQRDNLLKRCLSQSELKILQERRDMEKEKKEMADVAIQLRESHAHITRSFNELEERQEMLRAREVEMERLRQLETARFIEQASELDIQKRKLDQEFKRLEEEQTETEQLRNGIHELRRNLELSNHALSESQSQLAVMNDLQHQCTFLRRELHTSKHYLKQLSTSKSRQNASKQVDKSQQTDKSAEEGKVDRNAEETCRQLRQENAELRARSDQQEERIRELTTRATHLAMEVEVAQDALASAVGPETYHSATSFVVPESGAVLPTVSRVEDDPPPPPPPLPPRSVTPIPSYRGGGEDQARPTPVVQTVTPRPAEARETRRKPPRRLVIHTPTSSEESSPTDGVLQEARRRLRTLEEESAEVDRRFQDFKRRQASFFESTASILRPNIPPHSHSLDDTSNHLSRRNHAPSVPTTFYGASGSGLSRSRHADMFANVPSTHSFQETSISRVPAFAFNNLINNNNVKPYVHRMVDVFQSSASSDSDSSHRLFFSRIPSRLKMSPSVTKQTQTLETYESISNRDTTFPANADYPNSPHKTTGEDSSRTARETKTSSLTTNSVSTKQQSKKVQFVQHSNNSPSKCQTNQYQPSSLPNLDPTTAVAEAELSRSSFENVKEEDERNRSSPLESDEAALTCPPVESNYVERYELQQVLLASETSIELEAQDDENVPSVGEQRISNLPKIKPDNVLPDTQVVFRNPNTMLHTSSSDITQIVQVPKGTTSQEEEHNKSASPSKAEDVLSPHDTPQHENKPTNMEISSVSPLESNKNQPNVSDALDRLDIHGSPALQSSATRDRNGDAAVSPTQQDVLGNSDEAVQDTDAAKVSTMALSGSGSGFASSVGKMSVSSIAMSSVTNTSDAGSDEEESSETESSSSVPKKTTGAQPNSAALNDVSEARSSDAMSVPDEKDQSDDFWA